MLKTKRDLALACRVLTGRPLFVAMWVAGRARVSVELYLKPCRLRMEGGTDAIIPAVE